MEEVRTQAETHGVHPKSDGEHGWADSMKRKSSRCSWRSTVRPMDTTRPSERFVERFVDYCTSGAGRVYFSCVGRVGLCDKYFSNHLPCALAQKVFVMMGLPGWAGLRKAEAREKAVRFDSCTVYCAKHLYTLDNEMCSTCAKRGWRDVRCARHPARRRAPR